MRVKPSSPGRRSACQSNEPTTSETCAALAPGLCQDPKKIQGPGSVGSKIWDLDGSWIQHLRFCRGILGILDPAFQVLSWDPGVLDPAFQVLSWDPGDLGSCMLILSRDPDGSWILLFHFAEGSWGSWILNFYFFRGSWDLGS